MPKMTRVVILGGGVSGLTAAFLSRRSLQGVSGQVHLVEKSPRAGGWFRSHRDPRHHFLMERGPHSFRPAGPSGLSALRLLEEAGLEREAVGTSASASQRYLWYEGSLRELPDGMRAVMAKEWTRPLAWIAARESTRARRKKQQQQNQAVGQTDESVHAFFARRFSPWVADTFADAMVQGIFAGDTKQLSLEACFPVLHDLESKYGSVVGGMVKKAVWGRKEKMQIRLETEDAKRLAKATGVSFPDGMERLTQAMEEQTFHPRLENGRLDCRLFHGKEAVAIAKDRTVELSDGSKLEADFVLSALPIPALRKILPNEDKHILEALEANLRWASVGVINLCYADMPSLPRPGFGHLVPTNQDQGILGMIYDSEVFPSQQPPGCSALTVMIGGAKFPEYADLSEQEMIEFAVKKAEEHLGIKVRPTAAVACSHRNCIPQYGLGHRDLVARAKADLLEKYPFLRVFGNNFEGVGIADSIAHARKAVESIDLNVHVPFK